MAMFRSFRNFSRVGQTSSPMRTVMLDFAQSLVVRSVGETENTSIRTPARTRTALAVPTAIPRIRSSSVSAEKRSIARTILHAQEAAITEKRNRTTTTTS